MELVPEGINFMHSGFLMIIPVPEGNNFYSFTGNCRTRADLKPISINIP